MKTFGSVISSPIGSLTILASEKGLKGIQLNKPKINLPTNHITKEACIQLQYYFERKLKKFEIPLDIDGTIFEKKVWNHLTTIPYGQTTTYGAIAREIATIKVSRAVGGANGKNPIPIIVPCHRVIGGNGSLIGYSLGLAVKQKLLSIENPTRFGQQIQFSF